MRHAGAWSGLGGGRTCMETLLYGSNFVDRNENSLVADKEME